MLSLRVVHNFVNKFLKCSARLCVRAASLSTHPGTSCGGRGRRQSERASRLSPSRGGLGFAGLGGCGVRVGSPRPRRYLPPLRDAASAAAQRRRPAPLRCRTGRGGGASYHTDSSKIKPSPAAPRLSQPCRFFFLNILIFLSLTSALRDPAPSRPD